MLHSGSQHYGKQAWRGLVCKHVKFLLGSSGSMARVHQAIHRRCLSWLSWYRSVGRGGCHFHIIVVSAGGTFPLTYGVVHHFQHVLDITLHIKQLQRHLLPGRGVICDIRGWGGR
jgi:hypothetical protein